MGSVTNVSNFSIIDIVGMFASRIGVEDDADSRDVRFECMFEKIVPNLLVKDESFQLKDFKQTGENNKSSKSN